MTSGIATIVDARKFLDPMQVDVVLYHKGCNDGFGAAWAAWRHLGDRAVYYPVSHEDEDVVDLFDPTKRVLMLDITLDYAVMEQIYYRQPDHGFLVIDHHKTAPEKCGDLASKILHYDNRHSGAVLAWYYFSNEPTPQILRYVEDRDLWNFHLHCSRDINSALQVLEHDFTAWSYADLAQLRHDGIAIRKANAAHVKRAIDTATVMHFSLGHGIKFPTTNSPLLVSEIGEALLESNPDCPFAAIYYRANDGYNYISLRSRGDFDVSLLARQMGGGGHKSAAGFRALNCPVSALHLAVTKMQGAVNK